MDERDLKDLSTCRECGAAVDNSSRHRAWHKKIEDQIDDLEYQINARG